MTVRSPVTGAMMGTNLVSASSLRGHFMWMYESGLMTDEQVHTWKVLEEERLDIINRANNGEAEAICIKAYWLQRGSKGFMRDSQQAMQLFEMAGAAGNIDALFMLSEWNRHMGNTDTAREHMQKAAIKGSQRAWYCLAMQCLDGKDEGYSDAMRGVLEGSIPDAYPWQQRHALHVLDIDALFSCLE